MHYRVILNGVPVECDSVEAVRALIGEGRVNQVEIVEAKQKRPGKKKTGKSPGVGPKKSWAMAEWFAAKQGLSRNQARSKLAEIRSKEPKKFLTLCEQFEASKKSK